MESSQIWLFNIAIINLSFLLIQTGKIGLNIDELKKLAKCLVTDKSTFTLTLAHNRAHIRLTSEKYKISIDRSLSIDRIFAALDIDIEEIPMNHLLSIL